jgi:hypothetical protein
MGPDLYNAVWCSGNIHVTALRCSWLLNWEHELADPGVVSLLNLPGGCSGIAMQVLMTVRMPKNHFAYGDPEFCFVYSNGITLKVTGGILECES